MSNYLNLTDSNTYSPTLIFRNEQKKSLENNMNNTDDLKNTNTINTVSVNTPQDNSNNGSDIAARIASSYLNKPSTTPSYTSTALNKDLADQIDQARIFQESQQTGVDTQSPQSLPLPQSQSQTQQKTPLTQRASQLLQMRKSSSLFPTNDQNTHTTKTPIPDNRINTTVRRLSNLIDAPFRKQITNIKPALSNTDNHAKTPLHFDNISNTVSMASIPIIPTTKTSKSDLGFIDLTSDEGSYEDISFTNIAGIKSSTSTSNPAQVSDKFTAPILNLKPLFTSKDILDSINLKTDSIQAKTEPLTDTLSRPNIKSESQNRMNFSFNKFSYNDFDDESGDDDDDDDDIIITGVGHNSNSSFNNGNASFDTSNILPVNMVKREFKPDSDEELAKKRQQILQNKMAIIENNTLKEETIQNNLKEKARLQKEKLEKERINKLLEKYPPIKSLPQKYQIEFPKNTEFSTEVEPILPNTISNIEIAQDNMVNLADEYRVTVFRDQNISTMHSVIHRLNTFSKLHSKMDYLLNKAAIMRSEIQKKATNNAGNKKADIRYNQILRFIDNKIKNLSRFYGEVGMSVDRLQGFKRELIARAKAMEEIRQKILFQGHSTNNLRNINEYLRILPESNLIISSITEMYKLSGATPEEVIHTVREFSLNPRPIRRIPLPETSNSQLLYAPGQGPMNGQPNRIVINDDGEDEEDDDLMFSNTPFGGDSSNMPFSNIYEDNLNRFNPYRSNLNDNDGIKNLMESIKVIEFTEEGLANTPEELCISLLKHQRIGLSWMLKSEQGSNKGGILADDMGLGKTVQAISLILANQSKDNKTKTNLIVGPVSLLQQWQQEISMKIKDGKALTTFLYHSTNKIPLFTDLSKYDIVLISYQTLGSEWKKHYSEEIQAMKNGLKNGPKKLKKRKGDYQSPFYTDDAIFYRTILDEAQYIKNRNTIASKAVASLSSKYRWCLSGTPIQNKIEELYPLVRFLGIKPYNDFAKFQHQIVLPTKHRSISATKKIHALLSAILLRRTKDSEIDGKPILTLPEKHIVEEKVVMEEQEKEFYSTLEHASAKTADKLLNAKKKTYSSILTLLLRMRQACDHEYLVRLGDDGDRVAKLDRFSKGYEAVKQYENGVINRIEDEIENGFVCINCAEELAEEQTLLLSKCGHALCYSCHAEYFEERSEAAWEGEISAKCTTCGVTNLSSMSVDFRLYEAYRDGLDWQDIRKKFELDSKASDKTWRLRTIQKFIQEDGKLFISAKIKRSVELIENILNTKPDEKVIVFSQFMGFFDIIQKILREKNIDFLQYDGSMDMTAKNDCVNTFYKDPTKRVLLLSLKAGNVGLTLTCANHVIMLEPFWNPYVEKQAQDRVHRISQTREVFVHRLLIENTVEDRIMELQKEKEELVESALDPNARTNIGKLSRRELGFLFGLNGLAELEND